MDSSSSFTIDDVFELAITIERQGQVFYAQAAEATADPVARKLFRALVDAEERHEVEFRTLRTRMRRTNPDEQLQDPDGVLSGFIRSWTAGKVFDGMDPQRFVRNRTTVQLVQEAIKLEEEAIGFYLELKTFLSSMADVAWLARIIHHEETHRESLQRILEVVKPLG